MLVGKDILIDGSRTSRRTFDYRVGDLSILIYGYIHIYIYTLNMGHFLNQDVDSTGFPQQICSLN